jgi:hypothetical protein
MQRKLASPIARAITAVLAAAAASAGAGAGAQTARPPIVLVLDPCAAVDADEVRRLVPIEMGAPLAAPTGDGAATPPADAARADTTHVFVGCVPGSPQLVRLEVRDPESGRHVDRVITLVGESKTDQARLVAIVAVELVAASRTELREAPPATATPDPRALAVTVTPAPPVEPPRARWRAFALGSLRHIQGLPRVLPGGGLGLERGFARGFALSADALAEGIGQPTALGDVDAFLASLGVLGSWRVEHGHLAGEAGVGARGGFARLAGRATSATTVRPGVLAAPWAGPLLAARAQASVSRRLVLSVGGELGYVTSAVAGHVEGHPDVAVSGAWWNVVLGVGFVP